MIGVSKHSQTKVPLLGLFGLPMQEASPYFSVGRGALVQKTMLLKAFILGFTPNTNGISVDLESDDTSIRASIVVPFTISYSDTDATIHSSVETLISNYCTGFFAIQAPDVFVWDLVTSSDLTALTPVARSFSNPSLAVNTSRQPSTTRDTMVNASVDITSTISLTTGQTGKVALQYADNTGFSTNVVTVQTATNGNTGSLTLGLNLSQVYTASLTGIIPASKYYRLVTTNVTGTPTYGTPVIQEVLL